MEAQPHDTAEVSWMYHVADERSSIIHLKIIRNCIFSPAIEQKLDYIIHRLPRVLLDVRLAANDINQVQGRDSPAAFDVSRSHKVHLMDLICFSRIQQGVPFLGLASDVSFSILDYQTVSFDDAFDC